MWSVWQVFCDTGFHSACPLTDEDKKLMGASCWERLTVWELGLVLMGGTMLSKCLIQFSVGGQGCVPPCCLTWHQTKVEVMKIMATCSQRSQAGTAALSAPDRAAVHCGPMPPPETPGHPRASLGQSLVGSLLLPPGSWCTQGFVCALQESVSPVLCKFCNQIPLASTVKFLGGSQFPCQIPRLVNLLWVLELS